MRAHEAGRGRLVARRVENRTVLAEAHATSPLRFLQTDFPSTSAAVCLVTFGGGLVDGDAIDLLIEVEEGATLSVFTQSSTKVFRGAARQTITANVAGTLVLLPDPVAAFKDASYTQRVHVDLTASGRCVTFDGFTSGRAAFGERWAMTKIDLRTTIARAGRVVVNDALLLDSAEQPIPPRVDPYDAYLTLIAVGAALGDAPPKPPSRDLAVATSPLVRADGSIARIAAASPAGALAEARARLRNLPDIDVVNPFESRH